MTGLPAHVQAEVQRILDGAARRLLAEQLDRDPAGAATRGDGHTLDNGADEGAPLVNGQPIPVPRGVDGDSGPLAA